MIKEEDEKTRDYIIQKDTTTKSVSTFIIVALILLVAAVVISGFVFKWF